MQDENTIWKDIGQMNEIIQFATKTETDVDGFQKTGIVASGTNVWANIWYDTTNEADDQKQEKFVEQINVRIRYNSTVDQYTYLFWRDKMYDIYDIKTGQKSVFHYIKARHITT